MSPFGPTTIPLTNSDERAIVDPEDYDMLRVRRWHLSSNGYVRSSTRKGPTTSIFMHREVMQPEKGQVVDHIDRNKLDNRKKNLRHASYSTNGANAKLRKGNTSGYRGVGAYRGSWRARIRRHNKQVYLGTFPTKEEAAGAFNTAARYLYGEFASLNDVPDTKLKVNVWRLLGATPDEMKKLCDFGPSGVEVWR